MTSLLEISVELLFLLKTMWGMTANTILIKAQTVIYLPS